MAPTNWGAMWREAVNDIRATFMQAMTGQQEHPQGMGVPLSPTPQIVTGELAGPVPAEGIYGPKLAAAQARAPEAVKEQSPDLER